MHPTLLLVDDEAGITDAIRRMLRGESWRILQASHGQEALQLMQEHRIDVLVTDYKMPGMDGLSLCRHVRQQAPATYRILLSGQVDYSALRLAWQQGDVHRFVAKPWDNLLLTLDIREGIRQQQLLLHSHQLLEQLNQQQAMLLTDPNWIVRYVNPPLCQLLNLQATDIIGLNLFAPTLSAMPVTLETDVTRQTEQHQSWLGYFRFKNGPQSLATRMSISPLGEQFRLCLCEAIHDPHATERDPRNELQSHAPGLLPTHSSTAALPPKHPAELKAEPRLSLHPIFNPTGQLVALQLPTDPAWLEQNPDDTLRLLQQQWQDNLHGPLHLLIDTRHYPSASQSLLLNSLLHLRQHTPLPLQYLAIVNEDDLLNQDPEARQRSQQLQQAGCELLLADFGQGFLSPRQLLNLPVAGLLLDPQWLIRLQDSRQPQQQRRLLQRLQQHPLRLYAHGIDTAEQLAVVQQNPMDWLSGNLLSGPIQPDQISWFANRESGASI